MHVARLLSLLLLVPAGFAGAQLIEPGPKPAPANTGAIRLDVEVTAKSGAETNQLKPGDFTVLDNGVAQPIQSVQLAGRAAPAEIVLVVDGVNASYQTVSYVRQEITKYLSADNGQLVHPVLLAFLTDKGLQVQHQSSRDGKQLEAALDAYQGSLRIIGRSAGFYGGEERLDLSIASLRALVASEAKVSGRKLIIFLSPGWPLFTGPRIDLTTKQRQAIYAELAQITNEMRNANVTLYSVDPRGANQPIQSRFYYLEYLKGVSRPSQAEFADLSLQILATHSGGLVLNASNDLAAQIRTAVKDASEYYQITYAAPPAEQANEYHAIEVHLDQPGLTARTSQGYYSQR